MPIQTDTNLKTTGKIGDTVYYESNGEKKSRAYFIPVQPGTPAQLAWWEIFRDGVSNWKLLSPEVKAEWDQKAKPLAMEGFNLFMSGWLKEEFDMISKILYDTYDGDDVGSRIIDLGDNYDEIYIYLITNKPWDAAHLIQATAVNAYYGVLYEMGGALNHARHDTRASADIYFQGKMSGSDINKIKLGSDGSNVRGTNKLTHTYLIVAKKFRVYHLLP